MRHGCWRELFPPSAYSLAQGQSEQIVYTYSINDGNVGSVNTSATVTINAAGVNDPPVLDGPVTATFGDNSGATTVNLLEGATDPDGDTLNVQNLSLTSGDARGITQSGNSLSVNPRALLAVRRRGARARMVWFIGKLLELKKSVESTVTI